MREDQNKNNRTHNSKGQELSDMFVGEDGQLSMYVNDYECEVIGFVTNPFGEATKLIRK